MYGEAILRGISKAPFKVHTKFLIISWISYYHCQQFNYINNDVARSLQILSTVKEKNVATILELLNAIAMIQIIHLLHIYYCIN